MTLDLKPAVSATFVGAPQSMMRTQYSDAIPGAVVGDPTEPDPMVELLDQVKATVTGPRRKDYGDPEDDLACTGAMWSAWLNRRFHVDVKLTGADVSVLMTLLKATRLANTPGHRDSFVDTAGYAATGYRCSVKGA